MKDVEGVWPLASVRGAAFDDPRFEPELLRAAARAVLGPLEQVRSDDELVALLARALRALAAGGLAALAAPRRPGRVGAPMS
jgi:hypothetical protein